MPLHVVHAPDLILKKDFPLVAMGRSNFAHMNPRVAADSPTLPPYFEVRVPSTQYCVYSRVLFILQSDLATSSHPFHSFTFLPCMQPVDTAKLLSGADAPLKVRLTQLVGYLAVAARYKSNLVLH